MMNDECAQPRPTMRRQRQVHSYWQFILACNFCWNNNHVRAASGSQVSVQSTVLCGLSNIIYPGGHVTRLSSKMAVHWKVTESENDRLQMAFQYIGGQAWLGIGFSSTTKGNMLGSRAIIGVPGVDLDSKTNSTIQVYQLMAKTPQDASAIVQNPDFSASHSVDGSVEMKSYETVLRFSLERLSDFQKPDAEHLYTLIYAVGKSTSLGMHSHSGAFRLNLQFCGNHAGAPTKPPPLATAGPSPPPETSGGGGISALSPPPSMKPTAQAPSSTGKTSGTSPAPTRSPVVPQKANHTTTSNSTDPNDGGGSGAVPASTSTTSSAYDHKTAFAAHGLLATLSFAVLVPTAMASAWFRSLVPKWWIYVHVLSNCLGFFFAVLSVIVAFSGVVLRGASTGTAVSHMSLTHHRAGVALVVLVACQVVSGFCRPPLLHDNDITDSDGYDRLCGWTARLPWWSALSKREKWHWLHRGVAVTILGLAIYQLASGAGLYSQEYQEGQLTTVIAMWVWIACVAAGLICARLYLLTRADGGVKSVSAVLGNVWAIRRISSTDRGGMRGVSPSSPYLSGTSGPSRGTMSGGAASAAAAGVWRSPPARAFSSHRLERNTNLLPYRDNDTSMRDEDDNVNGDDDKFDDDDNYEFDDFEPLEPRIAELKSFTNVI